MKNKEFIIGDIHGSYKALLQCLDRSGFNKENDTLIQIGDVSDGWSQTPECVEELLTIKNLIPIRGNHDIFTWNWFQYGDTLDMWLLQGGQATMDAYLEKNLYTSDKHRKFWNSQLDYYIDSENRLFVHAGFSLYNGFNWSKQTNAYGIRNSKIIHWNRDCAEFNTKSWPKKSIQQLDEFKEIYIGHTKHYTTVFNTPYKKNIWNVDTGAGYSNGKLTIMDINTKEFWQSDKIKDLYPNEVGR